jgi:hypothetical protein
MQYMLLIYNCQRPEPADPDFAESLARVTRSPTSAAAAGCSSVGIRCSLSHCDHRQRARRQGADH